MKREYYLRIFDKATNEILFREGFKNITYEEAKYRAEKYLISDTALTRNVYPNFEVCLTTISSRKITKNIMNWKYDSNGNDRNVFLKSWDNYLNGKENKVNKSFTLKIAQVARKAFIGIFAVSFLIMLCSLIFGSDNFNLIKSILGLLNFLLLITYTSIISVLRDEFNYNVKTTKQIKWSNFKLELPSLFATITTLFYTGLISLYILMLPDKPSAISSSI